MNSQNEIDLQADQCSQFSTDEFVKVCEELGLLEPTINEVNEDMWLKYEDNRW